MTQDVSGELLDAGYKFRESLIERADSHAGHAPLWHGWALMEAFKAGAAWARPRLRAEGLREAEAENARLRELLDRYRYAADYMAADSWDGEQEAIDRLRWAYGLDPDREALFPKQIIEYQLSRADALDPSPQKEPTT